MNSLGFDKAEKDTKIIVAMSGGVDSSVAAVKLKREGYDVTGITLRLYNQKNTSKSQTILFLVILTIFASFMEYNQSGDRDVIGAISYAFGFVYALTMPSAFLAVLIMNKLKNNKEEYWNSLFFCLIMVLIVLLRRIF